MDISLEKIELVKDRTGVTYAEAREALENADGNVVDAIIAIEETVDSQTEPKKLEKQGEALLAKMGEIVKRGNVTKIVVKKAEKELVSFPVNVGVAGIIFLPWGVIAAAVAAAGFRCTVEMLKTDGSVVNLSEKAGDTVGDLKGKAQDAADTVKDRAPEYFDGLKAKAQDAADAVKDRAPDYIDGLKGKAQDAAEAVKDRAQDAAGAVKDRAQDAAGAVKEKAQSGFETVKEKAPEYADTLKSKAQDAAGAMKDGNSGLFFKGKNLFGKDKSPADIDTDALSEDAAKAVKEQAATDFEAGSEQSTWDSPASDDPDQN